METVIKKWETVWRCESQSRWPMKYGLGGGLGRGSLPGRRQAGDCARHGTALYTREPVGRGDVENLHDEVDTGAP